MKIIVVGCGRQGADVAQTLQKSGHQVTVIDPDPQNLSRLDSNFQGRIMTGVVFDRDVLIGAGIERADGLAAMTNSDDANIVTALLARNMFHVPQVVARVYDPSQRHIYRRLGLQTISPVEIGTGYIVNLLIHTQLEPVMTFGSGEAVIVQMEIPALLVGRAVSHLTASGETNIVAITRNNRAFIPTLGTVLEAGDIVSVSVMMSAMQRLNHLLGLA